MSRPLLSVENLRVRFSSEGSSVEAVSGVSFSIQPGEVYGLVGESGSGKSITGLTLMGLVRELGAEIDGQALLRRDGTDPLDLASADEGRMREVRGSRISMIFQDPLSSLNPFHRVGDQIAEAVLAHGDRAGTQARVGSGTATTRSIARMRSIELLAEVGIPEPERRARDFPHQFSGGMRQRVMIAMALANEPELLIADEPTTALDVTTQAQILDLLMRLRTSHGMAVLLISHDLGLIAERAERVTVLRAGGVVEAGPVEAIFANPGTAYTQALLAAVPRVDVPRASTRRGGERALVEVRDLAVTFDGPREVRAVDGVSLSVIEGSTLGLVGESGSGKSTLCRLMIRLLRPDAGSIHFDGRDISQLSEREMRRLRGSMQIVFQDPYSSLNPRHRVGDVIALPIRLHTRLDKRGIEERVAELMERVGLDPRDRDRFPHEFSGGQRQRIAIARALGPNPRLVVADEPVSALDVTIQAQILDLMRELQDDLGLTYVFVSHDLGVIRHVSDHVVVMRQGRIVESGSADAICSRPEDPYTRQLLEAVPRLGYRPNSPRIT